MRIYWFRIRIRIQHFKWIRIRIQDFDDQNLKKKIQRKFFFIFFWSKIAIYLFLGLDKGHPSYRRSLQNVQHFKKWNLLTFFYFCGLFLWAFFALLDPDPQRTLVVGILTAISPIYSTFLYTYQHTKNAQAIWISLVRSLNITLHQCFAGLCFISLFTVW